MGKYPDLAIIGGGVIGSAIAYFASKAGMSVTLVDRGNINGKASSVAAGLLAPSGQIEQEGSYAELASASLKCFPELSQELAEASGIDIQFEMNGSLRIALKEESAALIQQQMPLQKHYGFNMKWLDRDEAKQLEPSLSDDILGAGYCSNEGQVYVPRLLAAYREAAQRQGAIFIQARANDHINEHKTHISIQLDHDILTAAHLVLSAGIWTTEIAPNKDDVALEPVKGQITSVGRIKQPPKHIVFGGDCYVATKRNGSITIGSTIERNAYDALKRCDPTIEGILRLWNEAMRFIPGISEAKPVAIKAGIRPRTPNKYPYIGALPGFNRAFIATGHNSNGVLFSGITAQKIVAELLK